MTIDILKQFNLEELKTMAGIIMEDLVLCPTIPTKRLEDLQDVLCVACSITTDTEQLKEDALVIYSVMQTKRPVEYIAENCYMYAHRTEEGMTERVREYLDTVLQCPDKVKLHH